MDATAALRELYRLSDETRPPAPELYVRGKRSVVVDVVAEISIAPGVNTKHLLYGATGRGKSTQLRFFEALAEAYAEGDEADASALGRLDQALPGIAGFGDAMLAVAKEAGVALLPGTAVVSGFKAAMNILRLRTKKTGLVSETSPRGRRMQDALEAIFKAVRQAYGGRPIAVLIDGLEKMNGEAGRWMRETFQYTRLLTGTSVTMVIATPPCTFSQTNSALAAGWTPQVVYGFAPDDLESLVEAMLLRVRGAQIDPAHDGFAEICHRLATEAGGHPRHAMLMLRSTILNTLKAGRAAVIKDDVDAAIQRMREQLSMGLTDLHYPVLRYVDQHKRLPEDEVAATLFGDGCIIVHPPTPSGPHHFYVHPLLLPWLPPAPHAAPASP